MTHPMMLSFLAAVPAAEGIILILLVWELKLQCNPLHASIIFFKPLIWFRVARVLEPIPADSRARGGVQLPQVASPS